MNRQIRPECPWTLRVSAFIDGELNVFERPLVLKHLESCASCQSLLASDTIVSPNTVRSDRSGPSNFLELSARLPLPLRSALVVAGASILIGSGPDFVRGNASGDALHDLRHLAIWQVAVGLAAISAAITFRMSRILAVAVGAFLLLTGVAVMYDMLTGHRGPWTDPVHMVEVLAVLLLGLIAWPRLRLTMKSSARSQIYTHDDYRSK